LSSWIIGAHAQDQPPEVLLFGVFHFAGSSDVARFDRIDVSTPENQAYLDVLAKRLCAFRPTTILLEFDRAREPEMHRNSTGRRERRDGASRARPS
jgi:hypothetical protein